MTQSKLRMCNGSFQILLFLGLLCICVPNPSEAQTNTGNTIISAHLDNSGYFSLGTISGLGGDQTVEGWIYINSHANWARLIDFGNGDANNNIIIYTRHTTGIPAMQVFSGNSPVGTVEGPNALQTGTWIHLAGVVGTDNSMRLYVNGDEVATGSTSTAPPTVDRTSNYIGKSNWSADALLNGAVADIRIWNTARTKAEIQANMPVGSITGPTTGLFAAFPFGATGAAPTADISGTNISATQNGTITYSKSGTGSVTAGGFSGSSTILKVEKGTLGLTGSNQVRNVYVDSGDISQSTGSLKVSREGEALQIGHIAGQTGTYTFSGDTIETLNDGHIQIGSYGTGVLNQSAGTIIGSEWIVMGRFPSSQ